MLASYRDSKVIASLLLCTPGVAESKIEAKKRKTPAHHDKCMPKHRVHHTQNIDSGYLLCLWLIYLVYKVSNII